MPAPRSEAQRAASRLNGAKSNGPVTPSGKRASARNGLKHGMAAGSVLPDEMLGEVRAEIEIFQRKLKAQDTFELRLVEAAAIAQVQLTRLNLARERRTVANVRDALRHWDAAREARVDELAALLPADPVAALEGLTKLTEGCDRLADLWDSLLHTLNTVGAWDDDQGRLFLNLMGLTRPPKADADPTVIRVHYHAYAIHVLADPAKYAAIQRTTVEAVTRNLPTRERALAEVAEFVAGRIAALEDLAADLWERHDRPDREAAPDLALFDPSPEAKLLHRYIADAERTRRRALADLARLRADAARARREGTAPPPPAEPESPPIPAPARLGPGPRPEPEAPRAGDPAPTRSEPEPARSEPEPTAAPHAEPARDALPEPGPDRPEPPESAS
jgi:hypothetical protein